jgi:NAD(P)H-dependent flavin oxidoreductase YrpB (nitropropane dioxygenase family)
MVLEWPQEKRLAACLEEGVEVVSFFWGDPSALVPRAREAGARVLQTVGSTDEARRALDAGVDVLLAQGWEAGGHVRGTVTTMVLVPRVVDVSGSVPVVAAGGIADGRGVAAALALGAAGACLGTRFLASTEAAVHPLYQQHIVGAQEGDTVYTTLFDGGWPGAPHRTLRNSTVHAWERAGRPAPGQRPDEGTPVANRADGSPIERYSDVIPLPGMSGNVEALALYAGQSSGLVGGVKPAASIVHDLVSETVEVMHRRMRYLGS